VTDVLAEGIETNPKNNTWTLPMKPGLGVKAKIRSLKRFS
jgi:hypothetical protein